MSLSNQFDFDLRYKQGRRRAAAAAGVGLALMMSAPLAAMASESAAPDMVAATNCVPNSAMTISVKEGVAKFTVNANSCPTKISFTTYSIPNGRILPFEKQVVFQNKTETYTAGTYTVTLGIPSCGFQSDLYFGDVQSQLRPNEGNWNMVPSPAGVTPYDGREVENFEACMNPTTTTRATTTTTTTKPTTTTVPVTIATTTTTTTTKPTTTTVPVTIATTTTTKPVTTTTIPVTTTTLPEAKCEGLTKQLTSLPDNTTDVGVDKLTYFNDPSNPGEHTNSAPIALGTKFTAGTYSFAAVSGDPAHPMQEQWDEQWFAVFTNGAHTMATPYTATPGIVGISPITPDLPYADKLVDFGVIGNVKLTGDATHVILVHARLDKNFVVKAPGGAIAVDSVRPVRMTLKRLDGPCEPVTTTTTKPVTTTTIATTTTQATTTTVPVTIATTIPATTVATTVPATTPTTVAVLAAVEVKGAVLAKTGLPIERMMTFAGSLVLIGTGMLSLASRRRRLAGF